MSLIFHTLKQSLLSLQQKLKDAYRTRYIKVWHDHSSISAHGHILVLISVMYDPAFFHTPEEMKATKGVDIDVPAILETPEIHIRQRHQRRTNFCSKKHEGSASGKLETEL